MTESSRPPIPPPPAPRVPPMPPPPRRTPANDTAIASTQRQPGQKLEQGVPGSLRTATPSAPTSGYRPGGVPPMPISVPPTNAAPTLEQLVREAHDKGISDLHLGVGEVPRFRERGQIITTDYPVTDEDAFFSWLREILSDQQIELFKDNSTLR